MSLINQVYKLDPVRWSIEQLDFRPDPWQADLLRSSARRVCLNCCRQSGKSTTSAIMGLHQAIYKSGSLILLVSPSLRQSLELFRKLSNFAEMLTPKPALVEDNKLSATFDNKSRVVALPGHESTIRGFSSPSLVIEDEASRCTDDIYYAIRPMLAVSEGRLVLMSTPHGRRGHFHHEWVEGGSEWLRISITAEQCPRISKEFLEQERASLGKWMFKQEYLGEFVSTVDQYFDDSTIAKMFDDPNVKPLFSDNAMDVEDQSLAPSWLDAILDPSIKTFEQMASEAEAQEVQSNSSGGK